MDIMTVLQALKSGNPQQFAIQLIQNQLGNTPMGQNLLSLAQSGKSGEIESIARNIAKQRGIDFDTAFEQFKQQLGIR